MAGSSTFSFVSCLWGAAFASAATAAAPATPMPGPQAIVRQLLDGWREANSAKAKASWAPQFRLLTLRRDGQSARVEQDTPESLGTSMAGLKPGQWDVRLGKISINEDPSGIATLWAPYTFYMHGRKSHCGIESFSLYRLDQGWRIVQFADTHLWNGEQVQCRDRTAG